MKIVLIILVIGTLGIVTFFFTQNRNVTVPFTSNTSEVDWISEGENWRTIGNPPNCPEPFVIDSPVDLNLVGGILYPGQIRGTDYKPHGGFRFDSSSSNDIEVRAIMDGYILKASRYEADGEVQNFLFYVNDCGIMAMNDHLLTLSPKLQEVFDKLPLGKDGDSRTTLITPKVYLKEGELLATQIGQKINKNIFIDFGLYDLRKTNGVDYDSAFRVKHPNVNEYGTHALCWFDYLSPEDERIVHALPAGGLEGKTSDYCN